MTAAVPDPRFRDQLVEMDRLARALFDADGWPPGWWDNDHKDLCDRFRRLARAALAGESVTHRGEAVPVATLATIAAEVEARVQAAANQRAAKELEAAAREDSISTHRLTPVEVLTLRVVKVHHLLNRAAALAQPAPGARP